MTLHPTVDHMPGETPASFAARLARINGVNAAEFCGDFGIDHGGLFRGKPDSIASLAELVGADCDELSRFAWSKHNDDFCFRGEVCFRQPASGRRAGVLGLPQRGSKGLSGAGRRVLLLSSALAHRAFANLPGTSNGDHRASRPGAILA